MHDLEVLLFLNLFRLEATDVSSLGWLMTDFEYHIVWPMAGVPKPECASESSGRLVIIQDTWPTPVSNPLGLRTTL